MRLQPERLVLLLVTGIFFFIPFFWFRYPQVDYGGDSSRLYLYDPDAFATQVAFDAVEPVGIGEVFPNHYYLPFVFALKVLLSLVGSPFWVNAILNGVKLAGSFLFATLSIQALLRSVTPGTRRYSVWGASVLSGLFYVLSPLMAGNWDRAILSHNQVFLNPLMFYLFFQYLWTQRLVFMALAVATSFLFAPNFGLTSAPAFFAFYPLSAVFLLAWMKVSGRVIPARKLLGSLVVFMGIHAFHLLPQVVNLLEPGTFVHTRLFDRHSIVHEGVRYFIGVLPLAKLSSNVLLSVPTTELRFLSFVFPAAVLFALVIASGKLRKYLVLCGVFFLITLYLVSAHVGEVGVALYKQFFSIPGFSMFRNFIGQWQFVFTFFYALLFGLSGFVILKKLSSDLLKKSALLGAAFILLVSGWPFLRGSYVNGTHRDSSVPVAIEMDPSYEALLQYTRSLPKEGRILTLPLTDFFYTVVGGASGGAYIGPSPISILTGHPDFSGYQHLVPFAEDLMAAAKGNDKEAFLKILSLLSVRYILHNSDPAIYEAGFPKFPYEYLRMAFPQTQKGLVQFLAQSPLTLHYQNGPYRLYEVEPSRIKPIVYSDTSGVTLATRYVSRSHLEVSVVTQQPDRPLLLVFGNTYHPGWTVFAEGRRISPTQHIQVNGYANGWQIRPDDTSGKRAYTLAIILETQRYFSYGVAISVVSVCLLFLWLVGRLLPPRYEKLE